MTYVENKLIYLNYELLGNTTYITRKNVCNVCLYVTYVFFSYKTVIRNSQL